MKKLSIDVDMLGIVSFLVRGSNGQSCYTTHFNTFLSDVVEQLKPKECLPHLVALAFDNIPHSYAEAYVKFAVGKCSLTEESFQFLGRRGFFYQGKVPKAMLARCKWKMKYIYGI